MSGTDEKNTIEFEAAAYRRLVQHLRDHPEVQNIDLMNLAGFLPQLPRQLVQVTPQPRRVSSWSKDAAREIVYGMPYADWQARYQTEASPEKQAAFEKAAKHS